MSTPDRSRTKSWIPIAGWGLAAVAGVVVWACYAAGDDYLRAWRAFLVNFLFFTPLAGGLVAWPAIVRSCNGKWHYGLERVAAAGIGFALPSLASLVVLWIGSPNWAPWYSRTYGQGVWLDNSFIFGRDVAALLLFWGVAAKYLMERSKGRGRILGPVLIVIYCLAFTLIGLDLVMSLDPGWYSTLAGGYFFMTGFYIAITCWAFLVIVRSEAEPDQLQDLGRLIVTFSLMATYLMYSHLLPIWYEALPAEVRYIVPRINFRPWSDVSYALIAVVYLGPLVFLLMERAKRNRWFLGAITFLILAGMWVERWWLIMPTFEREIRFGLIEISMAVALAAFLAIGIEVFDRRVPEEFLRHEKK